MSSSYRDLEERTGCWNCMWGPILHFNLIDCLPLAICVVCIQNKTALRNTTQFINMQYLINIGFISVCSFIPDYILCVVHLGLERLDWLVQFAQVD